MCFYTGWTPNWLLYGSSKSSLILSLISLLTNETTSQLSLSDLIERVFSQWRESQKKLCYIKVTDDIQHLRAQQVKEFGALNCFLWILSLKLYELHRFHSNQFMHRLGCSISLACAAELAFAQRIFT